MSKTLKVYAILLIGVLVVLALLQMNRKPSVDWRKHYDVSKKSPFGLYVFNNEANRLFNNKIKRVSQSPYDYQEVENFRAKNILVIQEQLDAASWKILLSKVDEGATLMYISNQLPVSLLDTLSLDDNYLVEGTYGIKLRDKKLQSANVVIDKFPSNTTFSKVPTDAEIVGYTLLQNKKMEANFLKIKKGSGQILVHTEPLFLTNYYLLQPKNRAYAESVLSYITNDEVIWFVDDTFVTSRSPVRYILAQEPLRSAWYIFLGGIILFVIFNAKRKQRIIPVIEAHKNTSVDFVKSIGNLYLQAGDFHDMMAKKSQYFLHKVRVEMLLDTQHLDEQFVEKLKIKTGKTVEEIQRLVHLIKLGNDSSAFVTKEDFVELNRLINSITK